MSSQIKRKFIEANAVDGSKVRLENDQALRVLKADASEQEVFKLDAMDKLQFMIAPRVSVDPTDNDMLARKGYVDQKIADLVNGAPALLDTLQELAAAIGNDENFVTTITTELADLQSQINSLGSSTITAIQAELDATQVGAGLETNGSYAALLGSNYLGAATSLKNADSLLDSQIKVVADGLAQEVLDRIADVDAEESARIAEDLTFVKSDGSRPMTGPLFVQDQLINPTLHTDVTSSAVSVIDISGAAEVSSEMGAAYLQLTDSINATGGYLEPTAFTSDTLMNLTAADGDIEMLATGGVIRMMSEVQMGAGLKITNLQDGDQPTDAVNYNQLQSVVTSANSIQSELDATQVGAGLGTDGSYSVPSVSNYLGSAVSLKDADSKLDTQIKVVADGLAQEIIDRAADVDAEESRAIAAEAAIQSELDATQTGAGLGTDGAYSAPVGSNYLGSAISLKDADSKLDTEIKSVADDLAQEVLDRAADVDAEETRALAAEGAIQSELDLTQAGAGLNGDGTYSPSPTANHIGGAITLFNADVLLSEAIDDVMSDVTALENVSVEFVQEKFTLTATNISNGYITLANEAYSSSINAFVDRLAIHENDDYTVSVVTGQTLITFAGSLVSPGQESLSVGDVVRVKYAKKAI